MGELLDNFLKVYQLANFIKHSQLQQQLEQQRLAQQQEEHAYQQTLHDFQLGQHLEDIGATRTQPIGDIQLGFGADILAAGKKQQVTTPLGMTYQVPTYKQRQSDLLDQLRAKKAIDVEAATNQAFSTEFQKQRARFLFAKQDKLTVPQEVADTLGITPGDYSKEQLKVFEDQYARTHKDTNAHIITGVDDNGRVTAAAVNPKTLEVTPISVPGVYGKTKTLPAEKAAAQQGLSTGARVLMESAQKAINKARETNDPADKEAALNAATQAAESFPNELEGGAGDGGWAYIKPKPKAAAAATATAAPSSGPDPRIGKIYVGPNGTRYRVKGISPTGKAIVEPVP